MSFRFPSRRVHGRYGLCLLLLVSLAALSGPARAADAIPLAELRNRGALAGAAAEFLEAFNANDPELLRAFMAGYRDAESLARTPVEVRVTRQQQFRGMLGELSLRSIVRDEEAALEIVVHAAGPDGFFKFTFEASSFDPLQISSMGMGPAAPPEDEAADIPVAENLAALVEATLGRHDMPSLAVAVADGNSLDVAVRGVRDVETGEPVAEGDLYHIGSVTKSLTAAVAARLVDRGEADWDDKLGEGVDVAMDPAFRDATLTQLLRHRAGVDPLLDVEEDIEARWLAASAAPAGQRLALLGDVLARAPLTAPGTSFAYSNAGYVAAAAMLEGGAGRWWETLIAAEVFAPLGLESAGLGWPVTADRPHQPRGHWVEGGVRRVQEPTGYDLAGPLAPAGNVHMSMGDLARYGQAHLAALGGDTSWLTHEAARTLHTAPDAAGAAAYAMGWAIEEFDGRAAHLHAGSAGTFYAFLCLFPDDGLVVAVAMNDGSLGNDAVAREIIRQVRRMRGGDPE